MRNTHGSNKRDLLHTENRRKIPNTAVPHAMSTVEGTDPWIQAPQLYRTFLGHSGPRNATACAGQTILHNNHNITGPFAL